MRQLRAILILPGTVAVLVPTLLLLSGGGPRWGWSLPATAAGIVVAAIGVTFAIWTVRLFHMVGKGTLAPWDATTKLVVVGPYRHVRNPMISSVLFVLLGEALVTGHWMVGAWFLVFAFINGVYIPFHEEPGLRRRFGDQYEHYAANVPRWIPRWTAWAPPA